MFKRSKIAQHICLLFSATLSTLVLAESQTQELETVVVTATKSAQNIKDVSAAVSVISRDQIEKSTATTVDQLLQGIPGVYAARMDASSPNRIAQTYTRGLPGNSRTLVLLDGIPMNVLYDGQVDWSQLSTRDIERVEVVRGGSSGLYGANAMGGVINILSRAPESGTQTTVGAEYGSLNSQRLTAAHSQTFGATSLRVSASHYSSDGYNMWRADSTVPAANRDKIGTVKDNLSLKVLHELDTNSYVEAGLSYLRDEATGFYKPGTGGYIPQLREQVVPTVRYVNSTEAESTSFAVYTRFGKQWADTLATPSYSTISEKGYYEDQTIGLNGQHSWRVSDTQKITVGGDFENGDIKNHFSYPGTTRLRDTKGDLRKAGVFVQDEISLTQRLRFNVAARYDHWQTGGNQVDTGAGQPNSDYQSRADKAVSPNFGVLFKLTQNTSLRATTGRAFNLPGMADLYANTKRGTVTSWANPDLKPERVKTYDIGLDHYFGQAGYIKATLYRNEAVDFIYSVQRDSTNTDKVNVGGVVTKGLELEAAYKPIDTLTLTASHTINNSVIVDNSRNQALVGMQLTNVPRHSGYLRGDYDITPTLRTFVAGNYIGDRFSNDTNTTKYAQYTTLDIGASYQYSKDTKAYVTVANITDKKYEGIGYLAPGTTTTAGLQTRF